MVCKIAYCLYNPIHSYLNHLKFHIWANEPSNLNLATKIGCTCHDFINVGGHGQCKTSHSTTGDQPFCYVNQPSNCTDLLPSETDPGRKISAKACEEGISMHIC